MVSFHTKKNDLLVAAGIWDEWVNKETGEVLESFAILTDEASPFVSETGHDRQPVFVDDQTANLWLRKTFDNPLQSVETLRKGKVQLDLGVEIDRPLKAGWEKRKNYS
jgi:putative SOS response-associated peptidase YedK